MKGELIFRLQDGTPRPGRKHAPKQSLGNPIERLSLAFSAQRIRGPDKVPNDDPIFPPVFMPTMASKRDLFEETDAEFIPTTQKQREFGFGYEDELDDGWDEAGLFASYNEVDAGMIFQDEIDKADRQPEVRFEQSSADFANLSFIPPAKKFQQSQSQAPQTLPQSQPPKQVQHQIYWEDSTLHFPTKLQSTAEFGDPKSTMPTPGIFTNKNSTLFKPVVDRQQQEPIPPQTMPTPNLFTDKNSTMFKPLPADRQSIVPRWSGYAPEQIASCGLVSESKMPPEPDNPIILYNKAKLVFQSDPLDNKEDCKTDLFGKFGKPPMSNRHPLALAAGGISRMTAPKAKLFNVPCSPATRLSDSLAQKDEESRLSFGDTRLSFGGNLPPILKHWGGAVRKNTESKAKPSERLVLRPKTNRVTFDEQLQAPEKSRLLSPEPSFFTLTLKRPTPAPKIASPPKNSVDEMPKIELNPAPRQRPPMHQDFRTSFVHEEGNDVLDDASCIGMDCSIIPEDDRLLNASSLAKRGCNNNQNTENNEVAGDNSFEEAASWDKSVCDNTIYLATPALDKKRGGTDRLRRSFRDDSCFEIHEEEESKNYDLGSIVVAMTPLKCEIDPTPRKSVMKADPRSGVRPKPSIASLFKYTNAARPPLARKTAKKEIKTRVRSGIINSATGARRTCTRALPPRVPITVAADPTPRAPTNTIRKKNPPPPSTCKRMELLNDLPCCLPPRVPSPKRQLRHGSWTFRLNPLQQVIEGFVAPSDVNVSNKPTVKKRAVVMRGGTFKTLLGPAVPRTIDSDQTPKQSKVLVPAGGVAPTPKEKLPQVNRPTPKTATHLNTLKRSNSAPGSMIGFSGRKKRSAVQAGFCLRDDAQFQLFISPSKRVPSCMLPTVGHTSATTAQQAGRTGQPMLKVTPRTLVDLILGQKYQAIDHFVIIDCRFEFEYNGGHILNAINIQKKEEIEQMFWQNRALVKRGKKISIIFHCEFSRERGPETWRWFTKLDAKSNGYLSRTYRDCYILQSGYRALWKQFKDHPDSDKIFCKQHNYIKMDDPAYYNQLKMEQECRQDNWGNKKGKKKRRSRRNSMKSCVSESVAKKLPETVNLFGS